MTIPTAIEKLAHLLGRNTCEAKPAGEWTLSLHEFEAVEMAVAALKEKQKNPHAARKSA